MLLLAVCRRMITYQVWDANRQIMPSSLQLVYLALATPQYTAAPITINTVTAYTVGNLTTLASRRDNVTCIH